MAYLAELRINHGEYYALILLATAGMVLLVSAVDLISGYLQHCQFDPVEVSREQRVVQQELLRNFDNAGRARAVTFSELMFKVHPVRVPIIGYQDCIQRITREADGPVPRFPQITPAPRGGDRVRPHA